MKALMIVIMIVRYRLAPGEATVADHSNPPFWTWFIENPR
jgi:hypothetical protein